MAVDFIHKVLAILLAALLLISPAAAQEFPELTGRVVDQANLLDDAQEAALTQQLETLEANSTRQLVVATIADLQGYPIEDYGYQLGRNWAIGQAADGTNEKDNGVILIVAPNERRVRVEVGYGLEPVITDALASRIIEEDILPAFRDNNYASGITAGVNSLTTQLSLPEEEARQIASLAQQNTRKSKRSGNAIMILFWLAILFFFILPAIFKNRGGRRYRGGSGPVIIWGGSSGGWGSGSSGSSWGGGGFGGGFSGGGGSFGGGGASGGW